MADKIDISGSERPNSAGMRIYDISDRANPREIAFFEVPGLG